FIPANGIAGNRAGGGAVVVHADVLCRPESAIANVGSQETVVQSVQVAGTSARVPKVRDLDRLGRRGDRDRTVSGNRRCSARVADPTKFEFGERRNVNADDVSFA